MANIWNQIMSLPESGEERFGVPEMTVWNVRSVLLLQHGNLNQDNEILYLVSDFYSYLRNLDGDEKAGGGGSAAILAAMERSMKNGGSLSVVSTDNAIPFYTKMGFIPGVRQNLTHRPYITVGMVISEEKIKKKVLSCKIVRS